MIDSKIVIASTGVVFGNFEKVTTENILYKVRNTNNTANSDIINNVVTVGVL